MPQNFSPHLDCVKLYRRSWLKTFSVKGFDIVSESDLIIGPAAIIFSHDWWDTLVHKLTEMIYRDALFNLSGPSLNTPRMGALEVGLKER
jgi:hypothetical protein